jgi:outer membrane protein OmpA-like peptidoglycan-associated protein
MSSSLLDSLSQLITPDLIGAASSALGENQGGVSRGLSAALPMLLGGVASRANDPSFASTLFGLVNDPANDGSIVNDLGRLLSPGAANVPAMALGGKLLNSLFGSSLNQASSAVAGYAGIRPASASSLLSFGAPLVLSVLGKAVRSGGLNLSSLVNLLTGQRGAITAALPAGLNLDRYVVGDRAPAAAVAAPPPAQKPSIWRWLLPLLILLGALLLLSRCMGKKEEPAAVAPPAPVEQVAPAPAPEPAPVVEPAATPKVDVFFDVDVSSMPAGGAESLQPIVDYAAANPGATVVVSGFHDPSGDAAHNEELAKNRAMAVRDTLVAAGVADTRISMEKPVVTEGGGSSAQARRVEVSVR